MSLRIFAEIPMFVTSTRVYTFFSVGQLQMEGYESETYSLAKSFKKILAYVWKRRREKHVAPQHGSQQKNGA